MHTDRWAKLSPLLDELLELESDARAMRMAEINANDPVLAAELEKMLALETERPDFLSQPIIDGTVFTPQPGQEIGPYRLVMPLGEGGMGQVWMAVRADGLYERRVALKLLRPGLGDAGLRVRFTRERQILARLGHAHIARLLDAGVSQDGQPYLALDYVHGEAITDYAQKHNLDLHARLQLFAQVCAAVSHAHANLVVHRDLKPSNIMVTPAGEVCLLDFGIAKLLDQERSDNTDITQTGSRTFTLHYAAPEQLRGEVITTMTDVYALGVVLYELLTDRKPYELTRQSDAAWEEAILHDEPIKPSQAMARQARERADVQRKRRARQLAGDLDNIVLRALSKLPEQRYPSVEALAQDLRRFVEGRPVQARSQSLWYRAKKYLRRHALSVSLSVGISSMLAIALTIVSWQANRALKEAARAQAMQDFVIALFENTGNKGGSQGLDVRALLDAGVRRADTELANQPRARAELLGLIARLKSGLGDDREALQLLDRQRDVLATLGDAVPGNLLLESAALRGRSLRELGRPEDCLIALSPVMAQAQQDAGAFPLPAAEFLSQLGRCHRQLGGSSVARDLFGQALQLRQGSHNSEALEAESQTDLALVMADDGQLDAATSALHDALDQLRAADGERNALGVDIWLDLGDLYARQHDLTEAEAGYRQALDIALSRFGGDHPRTAEAQFKLAELLSQRGKLDEADQLLSLAQDTLTGHWGRNSLELAEPWRLQGVLDLERDHPLDAETALSEATRLWRAHGVLGAHAADLCSLSQLQRRNHEIARSDASAQECLSLLRSRPKTELTLQLSELVDNALDLGDVGSAAIWFKQIPDPPGNGADDALPALVRARYAMLSGHDDDAVVTISALQAHLPANDAGNRELLWRSRALQADLACRNQQIEAGVALREQVLKEAAAAEPERAYLQKRLARLSVACEALP
jgi:serine/threonine-protein kinase